MKRRSIEDWMWSEAVGMLERAERLQREFFRPGPQARRGWQPPADIYETEAHVWVVIAMPGVEANSLQAALNGNWLRVSGERPLPAEAQRGAIHRLELPYGVFERQLELPPFVYELEGQTLKEGCLYLKLRKR